MNVCPLSLHYVMHDLLLCALPTVVLRFVLYLHYVVRFMYLHYGVRFSIVRLCLTLISTLYNRVPYSIRQYGIVLNNDPYTTLPFTLY